MYDYNNKPMVSSMSINVNNQLYWEYYIANSVKFQQCAAI